jgi:hypothetical protein
MHILLFNIMDFIHPPDDEVLQLVLTVFGTLSYTLNSTNRTLHFGSWVHSCLQMKSTYSAGSVRDGN